MLCDECKKNQATFHQVVNINGVQSERHLCNDCAEEAGVDFNISAMADEDEFFDNFFENTSGKDFFSNTLLRPFGGTQKLTAPKKRAPKKEPKQESVGIQLNGKNVNAIINDSEQKRTSLQQQLKQAIEEERYEDAAKIKEKMSKPKPKSTSKTKKNHEDKEA